MSTSISTFWPLCTVASEIFIFSLEKPREFYPEGFDMLWSYNTEFIVFVSDCNRKFLPVYSTVEALSLCTENTLEFATLRSSAKSVFIWKIF